MPRYRAQKVIAVVFTVYGVSQLLQVPSQAFGEDALPMLAALHAASGSSAVATAIAIWLGMRAAWILALVWGAITVGMVLSLSSLLQLTPEESVGMPVGAAAIGALAVAAAVYLYRSFARER